MDARDAFEALADCPQCLVEGAVLELVDGSTGRGVVVESRCRLCGHEIRAGVVVSPRRAVEDPAEARLALGQWAASEGDPDVVRFVEANFCGLDLPGVLAHLAARRRIETSFDAVAWLFPGAGAVGGGGGVPAAPSPPSERPRPPSSAPPPPAAEDDTTRPSLYGIASSIPAPMRRSMVPTSSAPPSPLPPHKQPARVAARALVAVMMGDGIVRPEERAAIDRSLTGWGYPPMQDDDLGSWRPHDLGWPEHPEHLVQAMAALAYVDGERDLSEWRVVREFARAWGYSLERLETLGRELEREHSSSSKRFWLDVKSVFFR